MSIYTPDAWGLVEIKSKEYGDRHKIFAGWYGGYLNGDSWQLSSGNTDMYEEGEFLVFPQASGSIYRCHKECQRMTGYMNSLWNSWQDRLLEHPEHSMKLIKID